MIKRCFIFHKHELFNLCKVTSMKIQSNLQIWITYSTNTVSHENVFDFADVTSFTATVK